MDNSNFEKKWFRKYSEAAKEKVNENDILFLSKTGIVNSQKYFFEYFSGHIGEKEANSKKKILDVGCGLGSALGKLDGAGFITYGIDYVPEIVRLAKEKNSETATKFFVGDIHKLPFEDNFFDFVICAGLFQCLSDYMPAVKELRRVLRKGGIMAIATLNKKSLDIFFQKEDLVRVSPYRLSDDLKKEGFSDIKIKGLYFPPHFLNFLVDSVINFKIYRSLNFLFPIFMFFSHGFYIEGRKA